MALYGYKPKWKKTLALRAAESDSVVVLPKSNGGRVRGNAATVRRKKRSALWCTAFPDQKDDRVAKHTAKEKALYRIEAAAFVKALNDGDQPLCPVVEAVKELREGFKYGHRISAKITEVHHMCGRIGRLLRFRPYWLGVSKQGHRWIHSHVKEARKLEFICEQGHWNQQPSREIYDEWISVNGSENW